MRVQQLRRSGAAFAYNSIDPCQREFEFLRLRRTRNEKSILRWTRPGRLNPQLNFYNRSARRMRFQVELQQLEKNFGIEQWHWQVDAPLKNYIFGIDLSPVFQC